MPNPVPPLLVADSFLLIEGRVRRLDLHRQRFLASCQDLLSRPTLAVDAGAFWDEAILFFPGMASGFRTSKPSRMATRLALRPALERSADVQAAVATAPDPRVSPLRKGPDRNRLAAFRTMWARAPEAVANYGRHGARGDDCQPCSSGATRCCARRRPSCRCYPG